MQRLASSRIEALAYWQHGSEAKVIKRENPLRAQTTRIKAFGWIVTAELISFSRLVGIYLQKYKIKGSFSLLFENLFLICH